MVATGKLSLVQGKSKLKGALVIKEGVEIIGSFYETKLEYIRFPSTLEKIQSGAFSRAPLKTIEFSKKLKNNLFIWYSTFEDCNNLSEVKGIGIEFLLKASVNKSNNEPLIKTIQKKHENYIEYAKNIINSLSTDENTRNQEITDIFIDGYTYVEKIKGNLAENIKIENLQDYYNIMGEQGQCPYNNIVELFEAKGIDYNELIAKMIEELYVKPKGFDEIN